MPHKRQRETAVVAFTLLVVAVGLGTGALAQTCPEELGDWGDGYARAVEVVDGLAYYSEGTYLVVADVSDPAHQVPLSRVRLGGRFASGDLLVDGQYLYAVQSDNALRVVDLSNPVGPVVAASLWLGYGYGTVALDLEGTLLYVAGVLAVYVVDISEPMRPRLAATVAEGWHCSDLVVSGGYAYLAANHSGAAGLYVLDLEDPLDPAVVGFQEFNLIRTLGATRGRLYALGIGEEGFRVFDLADPASPLEEGSCDLAGEPSSIRVAPDAGVAWVTSTWGQLLAVDIADPTSPVQVAAYSPTGTTQARLWDVDFAGSFAFVATSFAGLRAVNVSDPLHPVLVGQYLPWRYVVTVAPFGDYLLAGDWRNGLRVLDATDPTHLVEVGGLLGGEWDVWDIAVAGDVAVLVDGSLNTLSLANPAAPANLGWLPETASGRAVATWSHYAVAGDDALVVVDLAHPEKPEVVGTVELYDSETGYHASINDIEVVGSTAYVAYLMSDWQGNERGSSLAVVDVSTPAAPCLAAVLFVPNDVDGVEFTGVAAYRGFVYIYNVWGDLWVVDATREPPAVVRRTHLPVLGTFSNLEVSDGLLYLTDSGAGLIEQAGSLVILDLSDPSNPVETGRYPTAWATYDLEVEGGVAYLATSYAGVATFAAPAVCRALFVDGFESGTTGAWSGASWSPPGSCIFRRDW